MLEGLNLFAYIFCIMTQHTQMEDLLNRLRDLTGLDEDNFARQLCQRAKKKFKKGILKNQPPPSWLERAAAHWIIELWQMERNECESDQLWGVDSKYSQIFKSYTVAELVTIMSELERQKS